MKLFTLLFAMLVSVGAHANWINPDDIAPEALLQAFDATNTDEAEFNAMIKNSQAVYAPIVAKLGGKLNIKGNWKDNTPNAFAKQFFGTWEVQMTGGLARRPEMTSDGFQLVICHELGHHLAGFPFVSASPLGGWMSNEGQSDYFATHSCARMIWGPQKEINAEFRNKVSDDARRACDSVWTDREEQNLCYRSMAAAQSISNTLAALMKRPMPGLMTPDQSVVSQTNHGHPLPQCRMDTSVQGALCLQNFEPSVIPGKNAKGGGSGLEAEAAAAGASCTTKSGYEIGLRPACWFKARM